jgi:hypothetical protein
MDDEFVRRRLKNIVWDSPVATRAHPPHDPKHFQVGECVMQESTLFWGLLAASLTNVVFLCVYL